MSDNCVMKIKLQRGRREKQTEKNNKYKIVYKEKEYLFKTYDDIYENLGISPNTINKLLKDKNYANSVGIVLEKIPKIEKIKPTPILETEKVNEVQAN